MSRRTFTPAEDEEIAQSYSTVGPRQTMATYGLTSYGQLTRCIERCRERGLTVQPPPKVSAVERRRQQAEAKRAERGGAKRPDGWTEEQIAIFERILDDNQPQKAERIAQETGRKISAVKTRMTEIKTFGDPRKLQAFRQRVTRGGVIDCTGLLEKLALGIHRRAA